MPSLAKSSSATSLSSQGSKSPPRKYDGIPPELVESYKCLCILLEKEMCRRGTPLSYIPSLDAFLWEAYKAGNTSNTKEPNPAVQEFLQILLGRLYSGADSIWTYYDCILIACIGYKYMGEICGDLIGSWRMIRFLLRWFVKHTFPTYLTSLPEMDEWYIHVVQPELETRPETALELLRVLKECLSALKNHGQK
jgi:hypothetical protein